MKKILILGATGAMGAPLVDILAKNHQFDVFATSRQLITDDNAHWIKGNALDFSFIRQLLSSNNFDCIVDFMNYQFNDFKERFEFILEHTNHYIFTSSARVYAPCSDIISEQSPRLLDVSSDAEYLKGDWYELVKAKEEDLLLKSHYKNYTIIRPSLTYNSKRLQLAIFEQNEFIDRVVFDKKIVFPKEFSKIDTTMTYGKDVALMISKLILNKQALCEVFNVVNPYHLTWEDVLNSYVGILENILKRKVKIKYCHNALKMSEDLSRVYQYKYARGISRRFSNAKLEKIIGSITYTSYDTGFFECINEYLKGFSKTKYDNSCIYIMAYLDKIGNDFSLSLIKGLKNKIKYLLYRFTNFK